MSLPHDVSRRSFLKTSTAAAALTALGAPAVLAPRSPNETLNVGCIGTGGRCRTLMKSLATSPQRPHRRRLRHLRRPPRRGPQARRPQGVRHQGLQGNPRQQGHRRRADRRPRPLARADGRGRPGRRQGRVRRKAADAPAGGGQGHPGGAGQVKTDRASRHAAALHAAHRQGPRADPERPHRQGLQGPPDLEPQPGPRAEEAAEHRPQDGGLEGVPRRRAGAAVRRVSLSQLALVLGLRRRRLHRPRRPLDRRGPLAARPGPPADRRRRSAPTATARASGRRRTRPRRCCCIRTTCRCISRRRSSTPATAP